MNAPAPSTDSGALREDAVQRGHERDAVSHRTIIVSVGSLIAIIAATLLVVHEVADVFRVEDDVATAHPTRAEPSQPAAEEEFTPDQPEQLHALHQSETERLTMYEWTDKKAGVAQIPIERAIDLLAERGLPPTPPQSEPNKSNQQSSDSETDKPDTPDTKPRTD